MMNSMDKEMEVPYILVMRQFVHPVVFSMEEVPVESILNPCPSEGT